MALSPRLVLTTQGRGNPSISPVYSSLHKYPVRISELLAIGFDSTLSLSLLGAHHFLSGARSEHQGSASDWSSSGPVSSPGWTGHGRCRSADTDTLPAFVDGWGGAESLGVKTASLKTHPETLIAQLVSPSLAAVVLQSGYKSLILKRVIKLTQVQEETVTTIKPFNYTVCIFSIFEKCCASLPSRFGGKLDNSFHR